MQPQRLIIPKLKGPTCATGEQCIVRAREYEQETAITNAGADIITCECTSVSRSGVAVESKYTVDVTRRSMNGVTTLRVTVCMAMLTLRYLEACHAQH